jgi:hypothetical protein
MSQQSFGNCEKHPSFPLVSCPVCESEDVEKMISEEIEKVDQRINAGREVIRTAKEQLKVLRSRRNELENMKTKSLNSTTHVK